MKSYQEKYEKIYRNILEEMYGVLYDKLVELSKLCSQYKLDWYRLIYVEENKIYDFPKKSKYKNNKLAKEIFKEPMGILFNHTPVSTEEVQKKELERLVKVKNSDDKSKIIQLLLEIKLGF